MNKILMNLLFLVLMLPLTTPVQAQCLDNANMCSITVNLEDSYGDGWNGAILKIYQGSILRDSLTFQNGYSETVSVQVCPETIRLEWFPGANNNECSFEIMNNEGIVIYSAAAGTLGDNQTILGGVEVICNSCFRPTNFVSTANTATSVSLQWNNIDSLGILSEIIYASSGFSPNENVMPGDLRGTSLSTPATSATINNLSADTVYDFFIRTYCGDNNYSEWAGPVTVRPGSYNMATSGHSTTTACGLYIYDDGGVASNYSKGCDASLTIYPDDTNSLVVISGTLILNSNTYNKLTFYDGTSTSAPQIATYTGNNDTPVSIPQIMSTSGAITIKFVSNYSTTYSGFELHSSCIPRPTCSPIENINIANVTGTSAMIEWTNMRALGDQPALYELVLTDAATNTVMQSETSSEQYYLFSGLNPESEYRVKVRGYCDNGEYGLWDSTTFETTCLLGGDVSIAHGTNVSAKLPLNFGRNYSYTQQIYDAIELNGEANITGISFFIPTNFVQFRTINIYLGHTSQSTFSSTNDYIPADSLKLVYSGTFNFNTNWNNIIFDSAFMYNGTSNLVVAVDDNTGSVGNSTTFQALSISSKTIYFEDSDANPDPASDLSSYTGSKGTQLFRNNITFIIPCDTTATCIRPDVYVSNINGNEVEIIWAPGYQETSWDVEIKASTDSVWTLDISGTSQTSHTIYGLDYNTTYDIRVTSVCGTERKSSTTTARTACGTITELPFIETFDTWQAGNNVALDPCWSRISYSVGSSFTYPNVSSAQSLSQNNSIQMSANTSNHSALILPAFDYEINTLKVSFSMYKTVATQHGIQIGVITNPADISTFTAISTIDNSTANQWEAFEVSLDTYIGTEGYIAFLLPNTTSSSAIRFIDNISVNTLYVGCDPVGGVATGNITSTSATITWIDSIPSIYGIEYGLHGFVPGTGSFDTTSNTSYTINNLIPLSEYDVYVYRICYEGDTSDASIIVSFNTPCGEITTLPFTENFDTWQTGPTTTFQECWYRMTNASSVTTYVYTKNDKSVSQPNSLYMQCRESYYSMVVLPKIAVAIDSLQMSFNMNKTGNSAHSIEIGVITDPTDAATFSAVSTATATAPNTWQGVQIQFDSYNGPDGHIAIKVPTGMYINYNIDDIVIDYIPQCLAPNNLTLGGYVENGIAIDWTEIGNATQWEICYDTMGFDLNNNQGRVISNITSHPYTIQNLSSDTIYDVYVRSVCGGSNISEWSAAHITSRAGVYSIATSGIDTIYACAARIYDDGGADNNYSGSANGCVTIFPSSAGNLLTVSGTVITQQLSDYLKIYDGSDTNANILAYVSGTSSISCTSSFGPITIQFVSDYGLNYDGFDLDVQCLEVSCYMVQNLRDSIITSSTATISWDEIGTATQWEIEYGTHGFAHGNGNTLIANTTSYTITNLQPTTSYDIYVRAVCDANDESQWRMINITTGICDDPITKNIGNGTRGDYQYPFYTHYRYSYTQQIYTASEIGLSENGLSVDFASMSLQYICEQAVSRNISIYMGHTTDSVFASGNAWVADTMLQLVYSGTVNWNNSRSGYWMEIIFDTTFNYNGVDNIVVAIADNTGSEVSSFELNRFYTHTTNGNKALACNSDNNPINISSPANGSTANYRNNIRLISCGYVCNNPENVTVTTDRTTATLTWNIVGDYEISYKKTSENDWNEGIIALNTNTFEVENIMPETSYDFRVRKICDSNTYSDWVMVRDTTLEYNCATPTALQADNITYTSATISWQTADQNTDGWRIAYGYGNDASLWDTIVATESHVILNDLYSSTQYTVYIQQICNQTVGVYSDWSDAYTFSTTTCESVSNVEGGATNSSTATITWNTANGQTKWEVRYGVIGTNEENCTPIIVENNPTCTIEGLEGLTYYDVYVRSICQEGVYSAWSPKFQFSTPDIGINTAAGDNVDVHVYPNPANTETTIAVEGITGKAEFAVADINGRMIITETINCEGQLVKTIDVSNMAKGTYFVHIYNDNINTTRKFIVK